jgi:hypothetical protein
VAERLDEYDFGASTRDSKYPWDEWADGSIWKVKTGKDFTCKPTGFRKALQAQAAKREMQVQVRNEKDGLVFQFYLEGWAAPMPTREPTEDELKSYPGPGLETSEGEHGN